MKTTVKRLTYACSALALAAITLTACNQHQNDADTNNSAAAAATPEAPANLAGDAHGNPQPSGPEMLSTVGLYDKQPTTEIASLGGVFAIEPVDGVDTLNLDGKPVKYTQAGADAPALVSANDAINLVGVFELPQESVAWVVITGGAACPGTHVLVGARDGRALPGQSIPGCDDRGTMRRQGDHITFEAGGSEGTYQDGMITVTSNANRVEAAPQP